MIGKICEGPKIFLKWPYKVFRIFKNFIIEGRSVARPILRVS
jgi:hypothetical protein